MITLMCYNIERGFHSRDHVLEESRLKAAQRIVKQVNPDILALTEACYGGPNSHKIDMNYKQIFNFPYGQFGGYPGFGPRQGDEGGNCLLSKLPMEAEAVKLAFKGAVRGKIQLEDQVLNVDVVHPSYSVDDNEKIKTLTPLITSGEAPYIVTGDFNTLHPEDQYDWNELREELQSFEPSKVEQIITTWQNPHLVNWLLSLGLVDAFSSDERESTVPTFYTYNKHTKGVRMDFTFMSPELKVKESYVLKNDDTEFASDHYPIVSIFEL